MVHHRVEGSADDLGVLDRVAVNIDRWGERRGGRRHVDGDVHGVGAQVLGLLARRRVTVAVGVGAVAADQIAVARRVDGDEERAARHGRAVGAIAGRLLRSRPGAAGGGAVELGHEVGGERLVVAGAEGAPDAVVELLDRQLAVEPGEGAEPVVGRRKGHELGYRIGSRRIEGNLVREDAGQVRLTAAQVEPAADRPLAVPDDGDADAGGGGRVLAGLDERDRLADPLSVGDDRAVGDPHLDVVRLDAEVLVLAPGQGALERGAARRREVGLIAAAVAAAPELVAVHEEHRAGPGRRRARATRTVDGHGLAGAVEPVEIEGGGRARRRREERGKHERASGGMA